MIKVILLASYLLKSMLFWVPLESHSFYEEKQDTLNRYVKIAIAISETISEDNNLSVFENDKDKIKEGLLLASIASTESGFQKNVVECKTSGDHGAAWGPWQTHTNKKETCNDLVYAAKMALNYIQISFQWCNQLSLSNRLSGYTDGKCRESWESQRKINRALQYEQNFKPEFYNSK